MNAFMISATDEPGLALACSRRPRAVASTSFPAYGLADGTIGLVLVSSNDEAGSPPPSPTRG